MNAFLTSLATANPARCVTGQYTFDFLDAHFSLAPAERDLYRRILIDGPIKTRTIAVDFDEQVCSCDPDEQIARFLKQAKALCVAAAQEAMRKAALLPSDIGGLVVNTCTGYLCPGLSSYIAEALHLDRSVRIFDLMGMGCGAAIPNLQCAAMLLPSVGEKSVLSIAVEICSATLFMGPEPDLVVSNSIFGDGAAACVLTKTLPLTRGSTAQPGGGKLPKGSTPAQLPAGGRRYSSSPVIELIDFETTLLPRYREDLRYRIESGRLRNALSRRVPAIGASAIAQSVARLLARHNLSQDDIAFWAVHPGGTAVLRAIQRKLHLPQHALASSYRILERYGNMSSPSVLFVLQEHLQSQSLRPNQFGLALSFGAGFSAHAALLQYS